MTVQVRAGTFTLKVNGVNTNVGPFTGTLHGLVAADGRLTCKPQDIVFGSFGARVILPAEVHPVATGIWTGSADPGSGTVVVRGPLRVGISAGGLLSNCPLGPVAVNAATNRAGGVEYDDVSRQATVVDPGFGIDPIRAGATGCGGLEGAANAALGLSGHAGAGALTMTIEFAPGL